MANTTHLASFRTRVAGGRIPASIHTHTQKGLALIFVLIMMTIVFSVVAITARITTQSERAMRNDRDRQIAFHAAEAAIDDALLDISYSNTDAAGIVSEYRKSKFKTTVSDPNSCRSDNSLRGICGPDGPDGFLYADPSISWDDADTSTTRKFVTYGEFTNRDDKFGAGSGNLSARSPRYIVQKMDIQFRNVAKFAKTSNSKAHINTYLVTAVGYGASPDTKVFLQAVVFIP